MPNLKKYLAIFLAVASIFIVIGCSSSPDVAELDESQAQTTTTTEPFETPVTLKAWSDVTANQLQSLMVGNPTLLVLDVRETYFYTNKHIAGAESLPLKLLESKLGEIDKTKPVAVYHDEDRSSSQAAQILADNGFKQIYNLKGGMTTWTGPVEP